METIMTTKEAEEATKETEEATKVTEVADTKITEAEVAEEVEVATNNKAHFKASPNLHLWPQPQEPS